MSQEPTRVTSRLEQQLDVFSAVVLIGVLVLHTVVFGGVLSWTWASGLCALTAVALLRGLLASRRGEVELPPTWILATLIGVWCWAAFQAVQLPPPLSGPPAGLPDVLASRLETALPATAWRPLALDFGGCLEALQKGALYLLAFGLAWSLGRAGYARWFLYTLVVLGCFEGFYGMLEQVSGNAEIFGYAKPTGSDRASGTYVNANHFAAFMGMALPAGIGVAISQRRGQRLEGFWLRLREGVTRPDAPKRALLVGAGFLIAVGLVASLSRGGSLAALLGIAVLAGVGAQRNRKKSLLVLALAGCLGLWIALLGAERLQARFAQLEEVDAQAPGRLEIVQDTAKILGDFPLRGIGCGSFEAVFPGYASVDYGALVDYAHCDVLQALAELGGPAGLLLLVCVCACYVAIARGVLRETGARAADGATLLACASPLVLHSFFDFNLHIPANALWWVVLLGLGLGCVGTSRRAVQLPRTRGVTYAPLVAATLVGGVIASSAVRFAQADWHARPFVERAASDKRPLRVQALSQAEAIRLWPFVARSYYRLGVFTYGDASDAQLALAEEAARTALDSNVALEREVEALRDEVHGIRMNLPPAQSMRSLVAFQLARGRELSPADEAIAAVQSDLR